MKDLISCLIVYMLSAALICLYSISLYFLGHKYFPRQSEGSLMRDAEGMVRGSYLLAQEIGKDYYLFTPRPHDKKGDRCNIALYNKSFSSKLKDLYKNQEQKQDVTMITYSSSLLDPYITRKEALRQAELISIKHNIPIEYLSHLIEENALYRHKFFFKLDIVNTNKLNYELTK